MPVPLFPNEPQRERPDLPDAEADEMMSFGGIGVAPGIAIGPVYRYAGETYEAEAERLEESEVDAELQRFETAIVRSERELGKIVTVAHEKLGVSSGVIFDAQLLMLRDPSFYEVVADLIRTQRHEAGYAVHTVLDKHRQRMEAAGSASLRERAADIVDVQNRVLRNLRQEKALSKIDREHIVVAQNLTAADVLLFSRRGVLGCVLDFGGPTSHVSIMARALSVPAAVSLHGLSDIVRAGDTLILDGFSGVVILNPDEETLARYRGKQVRYAALSAESEAIAAKPAETLDGHHVQLQANLEFREELPLLHEYGAEGVGLFRTEMLFLTQGRALDEDQQYEVYRDVVRATAPHAVTFRLIDLGGDKLLPMAHREANPFLGWRGVRILLDKPHLLRPQLRAILRASVEGPSRILLPMISTISEVRAIRAIIEEVKAELDEEGIPHAPLIPLGIMVEVPAVALLAERFAAEADFFSIGTNDLTQYTLAVDRGNDLVAGHFSELHPAVLALIKRTVDAGKKAGIPVSLCGEMAADPRVTPLLVGLGLDALSASPAYLTLVKRVLRAMTYEEAQLLAEAALAQPDAHGVIQLLSRWMQEHNADLAALLGFNPDS